MIGRLRIHVRRRMAGHTVSGESLILSDCGSLVTRIAGCGGMRPDQWKTVLMISDLVHRRRPAVHAVTALALCAHPPTVKIGMAVAALSSDIFENRLHVALYACDALVHAAQGESRLAVIELRLLADRPPPQKGVTVLARNIQRTMRILLALNSRLRSRLRRSSSRCG
jgi:hypothetical protein